MTEHRWSKFWWQDWQADQALRSCSIAARGLWMDMLCIAHNGTPRGHVTINGQAVAPKRLATLAGIVEKECTKLLAELEEAGVFSRTEDGTIYSRRMVRDTGQSEAGREAIGRRWSKASDPNSPPNRSENNEDGCGDESPPKLSGTKSKSHFVDAAGVGKNSVEASAQVIEIARSELAHPNTPPNRDPLGGPTTLEAEAEAEREKEISLPVPEPADAERAETAAAPQWPPPPLPSAIAATVGVLTAKLEGRHRDTKPPGPVAPRRTAEEQLAALGKPKLRAHYASEEALKRARAELALRAAPAEGNA